jgi:hypothetical protein
MIETTITLLILTTALTWWVATDITTVLHQASTYRKHSQERARMARQQANSTTPY